MSDSDPCCYPNCRQSSVVILGYADNITLCDKHWTEHCDIDLPDDATLRQCITHERKNLQLHSKCGSEGAKRALEKLKRDPENYVFKSISVRDGVYLSIAEYRKHLEAKAADAAEEEELEQAFKLEDDEPVEEPAVEAADDDFFGDFDE